MVLRPSDGPLHDPGHRVCAERLGRDEAELIVAATPSDVPVRLSKFHRRSGQPLTNGEIGNDARHQSSFLICAHNSALSLATLIGEASQAYDASVRARVSIAACCSANFAPVPPTLAFYE